MLDDLWDVLDVRIKIDTMITWPLRQCNCRVIMNYDALPEELKHVITLYALDVHSEKRRALYTSIRLWKFVRLIDHVSMSTESRDTLLETVKSGGTIDDFINDVFQAHTE